MGKLGNVLEWITESEENTLRFRADFSVVDEVAEDLSAEEIIVLQNIHKQGLLGGTAPSAEVVGMRSYGWDDKKEK
jgi:hypothetical protein